MNRKGAEYMRKCMVILNPSSGKEQALEYEQAIREQLHNFELTFMKTSAEGDATKFARQACLNQYDSVILVGGDGTLNEGINGIAEQSHLPVIGVVPLGTVNDFARALGIPLEPKKAIEKLGDKTLKADIGKINDHYFTNIVAIGSIAEVVGEVTVEQKTALGPFAYLLEGVKAIINQERFEIEVTTGESYYKEEAMLFLCALTNSVGSFKQINEEATVSDGLVHCFILKNGSMLQVAAIAKHLITGEYEEDENITKFSVQELTVQANKQLSLNIDGDLITTLPAKIEVLHKHLEFYC